MDEQPTVSVIVPVAGGAITVERCLECIMAQDYPADSFEVVLVDNGCEASLSELAQGFPNVVVVSEPKKGSYAARNRGIRGSVGEIIAFTDADCIPERSWLSEGVKQLLCRGGVVAGHVDVFFNDSTRPLIVEAYDRAANLDQRRYVEAGFAATANLFVSKEVFVDVGYFREDLLSGGDRQWCMRATEKGYSISYCGSCVVLHPARKSLSEIYDKTVRVVGGSHVIGEGPKSADNVVSRILSDQSLPWTTKAGALYVAGFVFVVSLLERIRLSFPGMRPRNL